MNRRLVRRLLRLYPRAWRERYGSELASLADELISAGETTPLRAGLNLFAGAAVERWRALASRGALLLSELRRSWPWPGSCWRCRVRSMAEE